jgi:hypothetical protein
VRESLHERLEPLQHARDLRLLQHELADERPPGRTIRPPGKIPRRPGKPPLDGPAAHSDFNAHAG